MDSHDTLLIACKTAENRDYLRSALEERFNLLYAANSRQMIMLLKQNADCIATVIIDITQQGGIDGQAFAEPENLKLLSMLPKSELKRIKPELIEKYWPKKDEEQ